MDGEKARSTSDFDNVVGETKHESAYKSTSSVNWNDRLSQAQDRLADKRILLENHKEQVKHTMAEIKRLRREHSKEKSAYSNTVNECAQKLHDSIIHYEAARERKEKLLERQQVLNANYDKLYEKAQEMKTKLLAVQRKQEEKAKKIEQNYLNLKSQLTDAHAEQRELKQKEKELIESLRHILINSLQAPGEEYFRNQEFLENDEEVNQFYRGFLQSIQEIKEDIVVKDTLVQKIVNMQKDMQKLNEHLAETYKVELANSEEQAKQVKSLYQKLVAAERENDYIQQRFNELTKLWGPAQEGFT